MAERRLPTQLAAYQDACFDPGTGDYTGFQCPEMDPDCPIKEKGDGFDIMEALRRVAGWLELDHHDGSRFSRTKSTYREQVVARCRKCHTKRHARDPSASRVPQSMRGIIFDANQDDQMFR